MEISPALVSQQGAEISAIEGFADGSFKLTMLQNATKVVKAFDEKGEPVKAGKTTGEANSLSNVRFFNLGSAVRHEKDTWKLFSANAYPISLVTNVIDFLGDGNILVAENDRAMKLVSFGGEALVSESIIGYEKFINGCYVLVFSDGLKRMYYPDGKALSVMVRDSVFLPDGFFVHYEGKLISGVYRPDGIVDRREIYSFKIAGNYYLFSGEFDNGVLYDDNTQEIGKNYRLLSQEENFCLFEHEGQIELFNQFGKVATFSAQ